MLRERLTCAQRIFDEYTIARQARRREAELAWARLSHEASLATRPEAPARQREKPGVKPLPFEAPDLLATPAEAPAACVPDPATVGAAAAPVPSPERRGSVRRPFFVLLVVAIAGSVATVGVAHLRLRGMTAQQQAALPGTIFAATIRPAAQFTITAPVTTVVQRVLVSVGDAVSPGQPLILGHDGDAKMARDAAQLGLRRAEMRNGDLQRARDRLASATITAAAPGIVVELLARPGDRVYAGAPLVRIAVLDPLIAQVQVAPSLVKALVPGGPAIVTLPGVPVRHAPGTISSVSSVPNRIGNQVVDVRFENSARQLISGQTAEVRFVFP